MESLAILAVLVMLSFLFVAAACLAVSFLGLRLLGAVLGGLSVVAGLWLLCILPHVPIFGGINILAGAVAIRRYLLRKKNDA